MLFREIQLRKDLKPDTELSTIFFLDIKNNANIKFFLRHVDPNNILHNQSPLVKMNLLNHPCKMRNRSKMRSQDTVRFNKFEQERGICSAKSLASGRMTLSSCSSAHILANNMCYEKDTRADGLIET